MVTGLQAKTYRICLTGFTELISLETEKLAAAGLGLSIAKKLTSAFDGDVYVESEPNVRTAFINKFKIYNDTMK